MSARTRAYLYLTIATIIWSIAGPVVKFTLNSGLSPTLFLTYRFGLSSLIGLVALKLSPIRLPKGDSDRFWLFIYCLLNSTVSLGLLFVGYEYTSSLTASILSTAYPILAAITGAIYLNERITKREKLGLGIGLAGTLLVTLEPLLTVGYSGQDSLIGNVLILASLLVGLVLAVMTKLMLRQPVYSSGGLTHLTFIVGFFTMLPFLAFDRSMSLGTLPLSTHLGVWYMAIFSGTLGYYLWNVAQKSIEVSEVAVFSYTYPIFTLPLSVWWLHETITPMFIVGCIIIAGGVILAELKPGQARHLVHASHRLRRPIRRR